LKNDQIKAVSANECGYNDGTRNGTGFFLLFGIRKSGEWNENPARRRTSKDLVKTSRRPRHFGKNCGSIVFISSGSSNDSDGDPKVIDSAVSRHKRTKNLFSFKNSRRSRISTTTDFKQFPGPISIDQVEKATGLSGRPA